MSLKTPDTNLSTYVDFTKLAREPILSQEMYVSQPYHMGGSHLVNDSTIAFETFGVVSAPVLIIPSAQEPARKDHAIIPETLDDMRLMVAKDGVPLAPFRPEFQLALNTQRYGPPPGTTAGFPDRGQRRDESERPNPYTGASPAPPCDQGNPFENSSERLPQRRRHAPPAPPPRPGPGMPIIPPFQKPPQSPNRPPSEESRTPEESRPPQQPTQGPPSVASEDLPSISDVNEPPPKGFEIVSDEEKSDDFETELQDLERDLGVTNPARSNDVDNTAKQRRKYRLNEPVTDEKTDPLVEREVLEDIAKRSAENIRKRREKFKSDGKDGFQRPRSPPPKPDVSGFAEDILRRRNINRPPPFEYHRRRPMPDLRSNADYAGYTNPRYRATHVPEGPDDIAQPSYVTEPVYDKLGLNYAVIREEMIRRLTEADPQNAHIWQEESSLRVEEYIYLTIRQVGGVNNLPKHWYISYKPDTPPTFRGEEENNPASYEPPQPSPKSSAEYMQDDEQSILGRRSRSKSAEARKSRRSSYPEYDEVRVPRRVTPYVPRYGNLNPYHPDYGMPHGAGASSEPPQVPQAPSEAPPRKSVIPQQVDEEKIAPPEDLEPSEPLDLGQRRQSQISISSDEEKEREIREKKLDEEKVNVLKQWESSITDNSTPIKHWRILAKLILPNRPPSESDKQRGRSTNQSHISRTPITVGDESISPAAVLNDNSARFRKLTLAKLSRLFLEKYKQNPESAQLSTQKRKQLDNFIVRIPKTTPKGKSMAVASEALANEIFAAVYSPDEATDIDDIRGA